MRSVETVHPKQDVPLAPFTTLGVGGPARSFVAARSVQEVLDAVRWAGDRGRPLVVLGGGSNAVVSDAGVDGLLVRVACLGCELRPRNDELHVEAAAGEPWDGVVARTVEAGFSGLECLSGIPGSVGGTPIQNVGAYGQDVAQTIDRVTAIDRATGEVVELAPAECEFSYRQSRFKSRDRDRFIVTGVAFRLRKVPPTVTYPDVVAYVERRGLRSPAVTDVRQAILDIRRSKGMVLDPGDPDTRSVGSFFMNPVVSGTQHADIAAAASARGVRTPGFPAADGRVKIPAAWLIEQGGFSKGHAAGRTGLSSKHPLAIINRGGATAREIIEFAATVKRRVADAFGVWLQPEPVFVGFGDDETVAYLQKANG